VGAVACGAKSPAAPQGSSLRVTSITPSLGSTTGGTSVTIGGTDFESDVTVTVGGIAATNVTLQGSTALTALVGSRPTAGPADVVVASGGRTASLSNGFTFVAPSGANQPPIVTNIRSIGSRTGQPSSFADQDEVLTVVATVTDAETPASALAYAWTGPGAFAGSDSTVAWRMPAEVSPIPSPATATLTVTETFTEGSVTHKNVSVGTFVVQVHDSQKEILDMGEDFLTLFSQSQISTNDVLHNFSTACDGGSGRTDEKADVDTAHAAYVQDFSRFSISRLPPVVFNFGGHCPFRFRLADACSAYKVHWEVTYIKADSFHKVGQHETTDGIDYVTAVLESNRWRLCHSDFIGTSTNPLTGFTRLVEW
jgi:IPT/TIG domain